jgi:hypothetical protein
MLAEAMRALVCVPVAAMRSSSKAADDPVVARRRWWLLHSPAQESPAPLRCRTVR